MNRKAKTTIPQMSISEIIEKNIGPLYTNMINNNIPYDSAPSIYIWGPPGCGKSQGVRQLGELIEKGTDKKVVITDIRLLLFSPIDLRGVPVPDVNKVFTNWLKPKILDLDESFDVVNIMFLDELSSAVPQVQAAAYQLTLNRAIGEHRLPDNTIVIAAGNRLIDKSVAHSIPAALANRLMHFEAKCDFESWSKWAIKEGNINKFVLSYLTQDPGKLYVEEDMNNLAYPTPRSWMFVSNIINTLKMKDYTDMKKYKSLIEGCIGVATAHDFLVYCKTYKQLPKMDDIFSGKKVNVPEKADILASLIPAMTSYTLALNNKRGGISKDEIENACKFCLELPPEYAIAYFTNISTEETIYVKLLHAPSAIEWRRQHQKSFVELGIFR